MATWILHCHLGRRRVELPDPPTPDAVRAALERIAPRPGWTDGATITPLPDWGRTIAINVMAAWGTPLGTFKRSNARAAGSRVSIYLPPAVRDQLHAAADAQSLTVSELGYRLIAAGLGSNT